MADRGGDNIESAGSSVYAAPVLALALDVDDLGSARALAHSLGAYFAVAKIGLELYAAAGPEAAAVMREDGFEVFVDLKLHDIPTTVHHAAAVVGGLGARYVTMHTAGGKDMLAAGVEGLGEGAARAGVSEAVAVGVTVLTSDRFATPTLIEERAVLAAASGCGGIVCAAPDLAIVRPAVPSLLCVVPGTRPAGSATHDQVRVATPEEASAAGANVLVIGRAVTEAADPETAAAQLCASLGITPRR